MSGLHLLGKRKRSKLSKYKLRIEERTEEKKNVRQENEEKSEIKVKAEIKKVTKKKKPVDSEKRNVPSKAISPGIRKISEILEKGKKCEIVKPIEKIESKVKMVCNTFEEMMENTEARRKVYEVKNKRKKTVDKVEKDDRENPMRKNLERWMRQEDCKKESTTKDSVRVDIRKSDQFGRYERGARSKSQSSNSRWSSSYQS